MMLTQAGHDAYAYPAAAWARWGPGPRATDVVVVITHTAETAYAARARADALAAGVPVVSVTGTGRGWPEAIETVAPDESHTYTVSYTAALAVLARLAHTLGSPEGSPAQLAVAAEQVRRACADPGPDAAAVAVPARSLAIVGCGPWAVTAREGALKIREASRTLAEGFDTDRLLHGGAVPYTAADGLVVLGAVRRSGRRHRRGRRGRPCGADTRGRARGTRRRRRPGPAAGADPDDRAAPADRRELRPAPGQNPDAAIVGAWDKPALWRLGSPTAS